MDQPAYQLSLASVPDIDRVWRLVADGLETACQETGGDLTAAYLWAECRSGAAFLVIIEGGGSIAGASVWRFEKWTSGTKLRCLAIYGHDMREWLDAHRRLTLRMAKTGNANGIVAGGRKGWERLFSDAKVIKQIYEVRL